MYLKKIETQGFKSFANRAVLEFTPGIMGIVGPNGSGKSNVADAVRWVLGEQSARQLRGSNMQDVIFAGTEARRPMSYAFVSLTIDNSDRSLPVDYDEVTVSRQVFRSGESEYRLNGNLCRLRDIYETFYDSGIGKEGYSIIGQGQIEMVLSNKPEERRLMFDEAAGIVKYKKRRDITLKKLEGEKASRERVEDILHELERQVGPLEKQSQKAKTYLRLRDELKEYEVGVFAMESDELEAKLETARQNHGTVEEDRKTAEDEAERLRLSYEKLTEEADELDKSIGRIQARTADLRVANEGREGRIGLLKEQIRTAENNSDIVDGRLKDLDEETARAEAEREEFYRQKNETDRQQDQLDDKISALEEEAESVQETVSDLEFRIEKGNQAILNSLDEKAKVKSRIAALDAREEQNRSRLEEVKASEKAGDERFAALEEECEALKSGLAAASEKIKKLSDTVLSLRDQAKDREKAKAELEDSYQNLRRELSVLSAKKDSLQNMIERYEGYGGSVKAIMDVRDRFPGICGVVADLIRTDKKYETAVETVLGGRIQNVVTESEEEAKKIIEYLKANRLGRATFLPLDAVKGDRGLSRPEALKETGTLGTAASLVKADAVYQGIVNFLLGQTLVVDTMDHALAIARKYAYHLSVVTLDGEYLTPGGVISGGAYRNSSNLLGRRRELKDCENREKEVKKNREETLSALEALKKEAENGNAELAKKEASLHDLEVKRAALNAQSRSREDEKKRAGESLGLLRQEKQRLENERMAIARERQNTGNSETELDKGSENLRTQVTELAVKLDRFREQQQDKSRRLEELRRAFSNLTQKGEFLLENIRRCNETINRIKADRTELEKGRVPVSELIQQREEEIGQLENDLKAATETVALLEKRLLEEEELRNRKREEQQSYFEYRESVSARLGDLDKESFRLQSLEQRLEEQIEKQAEYLWTEYEMTPSQAKASRNTVTGSPSEIRRFITQKKREIKELGPVYVESIEKYKEVSERYEFLKTQREDLVRAENELGEMIRDLEKGMREQFKTQFALIQDEFSKVFNDLFAGGKGTLLLEDPEDVLSSGVIINAQPPGKKLQNMMQLSGGEKALTAIALLFAIQNLKPSPFCLLDEIESALDEPNVKRFADYLYRLKSSTQFLIITHRRGTMEMADRLYGITMQEKGVSVLVSVNLKDADKTVLDEQ